MRSFARQQETTARKHSIPNVLRFERPKSEPHGRAQAEWVHIKKGAPVTVIRSVSF